MLKELASCFPVDCAGEVRMKRKFRAQWVVHSLLSPRISDEEFVPPYYYPPSISSDKFI